MGKRKKCRWLGWKTGKGSNENEEYTLGDREERIEDDWTRREQCSGN